MTAPMVGRGPSDFRGPGGERGGRPTRPAIDLEVLRTEVLTSRMVRVVLGGPGIAAYQHNDSTDRYVKILFPLPSVDGGGEGRTAVRTYTVRRYDAAAAELWIDVVQHGDAGIAGPWAAGARPGDRTSLRGPGGGYAPDPSADAHLFVGDPAAFPAIAAAVEALPAGAVVLAVLWAHDEEEASYLDLPPSAAVRWVLADRDATSMVDAVRDLSLPAGRVQAFVHGELRQVQAIRKHLTEQRGFTGDDLSISGYWRQGLDEDAFQQEKRATR